MSKKNEMFTELVNSQPAEIKDWVIKMDKLLTDSSCKSAVDNKGNFTYTSKQSGKIVCRITLGEGDCQIRPNTINAKSSNNMANIPDSMLEIMRSARGCGGCAKKNQNFVQCKHGGPYQFSHKGEDFESCRYVGFNFAVDNADNRIVLEQWIESELRHGI